MVGGSAVFVFLVTKSMIQKIAELREKWSEPAEINSANFLVNRADPRHTR